MKGDQLALGVWAEPEPAFWNFFTGANQALVDTLRDLIARPATGSAVYLYGAAASGKTHLLHAAVGACHGQDALMLSLRVPDQARRLREPALDAASLLVLDDLDAVAGHAEEALVLVRLLDRARQAGRLVLASARAAPARLPGVLPDLRTRLEAMLLLGLRPLREADRHQLLSLQAGARGLDLEPEVLSWMLNHLPRDAGSLIAALERLDRATLSAKRRPTVSFLQQLMMRADASLPGRESARTSSG